MKFVQNIFDFYINASIHVALSVFALTQITAVYFGFHVNNNVALFIFFATISGYNFIKYAGVAKFYHRSLNTNLKLIQIFSLICFVCVCYFGWKIPVQTLILFVPAALLTFLYSVPFLAKFQKNLREISYLKVLVVAFVWAGVTSSIPLIVEGYHFNGNMALIFVQRVFFVVALTLPFEIRDLQLDFDNVKTIPHKIGVPQTKKVGFALLLFALVLEFLITGDLVTRNIFLIVCLTLLVFLMRASENQSKYYSSFWVESLPVFWWFSLLLVG